MNIVIYIIVGLLALFAIACCAIFTLGIPVIIIWKIYRSIRYGMSLYD